MATVPNYFRTPECWVKREIRDTPISLEQASKLFLAEDFSAQGTFFPGLRKDWFIHATSTSGLVLVRQRTLMFNARFRLARDAETPQGEPFWVLGFPGDNQNAQIKAAMPMEWQVPTDMLLFLGVEVGAEALQARVQALDRTTMYLVAARNEASGGATLWKLPLPNVHNDCKLCTGSFPANTIDLRGGLEAFVTTLIEAWSRNEWNRDLLHDEAKLHQLVRFGPRGGTLEPAAHWTALAARVGGTRLDIPVSMAAGWYRQ